MRRHTGPSLERPAAHRPRGVGPTAASVSPRCQCTPAWSSFARGRPTPRPRARFGGRPCVLGSRRDCAEIHLSMRGRGEGAPGPQVKHLHAHDLDLQQERPPQGGVPTTRDVVPRSRSFTPIQRDVGMGKEILSILHHEVPTASPADHGLRQCRICPLLDITNQPRQIRKSDLEAGHGVAFAPIYLVLEGNGSTGAATKPHLRGRCVCQTPTVGKISDTFEWQV